MTGKLTTNETAADISIAIQNSRWAPKKTSIMAPVMRTDASTDISARKMAVRMTLDMFSFALRNHERRKGTGRSLTNRHGSGLTFGKDYCRINAGGSGWAGIGA